MKYGLTVVAIAAFALAMTSTAGADHGRPDEHIIERMMNRSQGVTISDSGATCERIFSDRRVYACSVLMGPQDVVLSVARSGVLQFAH
jgi:hypothetical protein